MAVGEGSAVGVSASLVKVGLGVRVGGMFSRPAPELQAPMAMAHTAASNAIAHKRDGWVRKGTLSVDMTTVENLPVLDWATL